MLKIEHNPHTTTPEKAVEIDLILDQYKRIARRINELFSILDAKIGADWHVDGVGTCGDGPHAFDDGLDGDLAYHLPDLWEQAVVAVGDTKELGGLGSHDACPYHAKDEGCILEEVKPARCLRFIEQPDNMLSIVLGEEGKNLHGFLTKSLGRVMRGVIQPEYPEFLVGAEKNKTYVDDVVSQLDRMIHTANTYSR